MKSPYYFLFTALYVSSSFAAPTAQSDPEAHELVARIAQSVRTSTGLWSARVYESFVSAYQQGDTGIQAGANIRLEFTPDNRLQNSNNIKLIQFKFPLKPHVWAVDSSGTQPYFGWKDENSARTVISIPGMGSLESEVGKPSAGKGSKGGRNKAAFVVDTPREPVGIPAAGDQVEAQFTTFAYDLQNKKWLGGVTWGYILKNPGHNVKPEVTLLTLKVRTGGAPPEQEHKAASDWNSKTGNTDVPPI